MDDTSLTFTLDTDIGTDVDDLLALTVALASPELTVEAITTVYGDVELRARLAAYALTLAGGDASIPVIPGHADTRSGRAVWWPGHEGSNLPTDAPTPQVDADPIDTLAQSRRIVAIAPFTNLAAALERPQHQVEEIVLMGGEFRDGIAEHNVLCDVSAAEVVFAAGTSITAVSLDQTERLRITAQTLDRVRADSEFGRFLETEIRTFWRFLGHDSNVPHDPIAIMALAQPELFDLRRGHIRLDSDGPHQGRTTFEPDENGPHRIVVDFDLHGVAEEIVTRLGRITSRSVQASVKETVQ